VSVPAVVTLIYTLAIGGLMVSRLPVLSGKKTGTRVRPDMVPPVIVAVVLMIALLVSYPWHLLTVGTLLYLALLPLGWFSYQRYKQADAAAAASANAAAAVPGEAVLPPQPTQPGDERPARLN
jgi:CDP-diacylglycerol---serine O-phosphatidyltransferase